MFLTFPHVTTIAVLFPYNSIHFQPSFEKTSEQINLVLATSINTASVHVLVSMYVLTISGLQSNDSKVDIRNYLSTLSIYKVVLKEFKKLM